MKITKKQLEKLITEAVTSQLQEIGDEPAMSERDLLLKKEQWHGKVKEIQRALASIKDEDSTSDGFWDPAQGISEDIIQLARQLLRLSKLINKARDRRKSDAFWK